MEPKINISGSRTGLFGQEVGSNFGFYMTVPGTVPTELRLHLLPSSTIPTRVILAPACSLLNIKLLQAKKQTNKKPWRSTDLWWLKGAELSECSSCCFDSLR